jgi:2-dehydropantoate 2-reductase
MRFIVYGAGAIGGVVGAGLLDAGHEVVFIARGAHLDAMRGDGLTVRSPDAVRSYRVTAVGGPGEVGWRPGDVVLLAMKSMDTEAALHELEAAGAPPATTIGCLQNGVANERAALRRFADVHGVCVLLPAEHLAPGEVVRYGRPVPGVLDVGRYPAGPSPALAATFREAGFHAESRPDVMRWKHTKLLVNLANAIEALCGRVDGIDEVAALARAEGEAALRAAGIPFASAEEDRQRRAGTFEVAEVAGRPRGGGSSWQSLKRGTGTVEADHLNGEIVLLGRLHGVPTPVNELARRLVNRAARDRTPPGSLTPAALLKMVE